MNCSSCKIEFDTSVTIPLTCSCGNTLCKPCIMNLSSLNHYQCPSCKTKINVNSLWTNRGIDGVTSELKCLKQASSTIHQNRKPRIYKSPLHPVDISSSTDYQGLQTEAVFIEDKEVFAGPSTSDQKVQTTSNFILMQKLSEKKLCVEVEWGRCFIMLVYFVLSVPWVRPIQIMIACLGTESRQGSCTADLL